MASSIAGYMTDQRLNRQWMKYMSRWMAMNCHMNLEYVPCICNNNQIPCVLTQVFLHVACLFSIKLMFFKLNFELDIVPWGQDIEHSVQIWYMPSYERQPLGCHWLKCGKMHVVHLGQNYGHQCLKIRHWLITFFFSSLKMVRLLTAWLTWGGCNSKAWQISKSAR